MDAALGLGRPRSHLLRLTQLSGLTMFPMFTKFMIASRPVQSPSVSIGFDGCARLAYKHFCWHRTSDLGQNPVVVALGQKSRARPDEPDGISSSADLSHSSKVSDRRQNTPESALNRSES